MTIKNYTRSIKTPSDENKFIRTPFWAWNDYTFKGYINGFEGGKYAALSYIKFSSNREDVFGGSLQHAAIDLAERLGECGSDMELRDGVRGQMVGFFSIIDECVQRSTSHGLIAVKITEEEILAGLKDAQDGGPDSRYSDRIKLERSNSARAAANARWSKRGNKNARKAA